VTEIWKIKGTHLYLFEITQNSG